MRPALDGLPGSLTFTPMSAHTRARIAASGFFCAVLHTLSSAAHIDLLSPPPRVGGVPDVNLFRSPCGQRANARVVDKVSVFRPGQAIAVIWDVYVEHPSYFRIAVDLEGDDSFSERASTPADPASDAPAELAPGDGELILDYVDNSNGGLEHVERVVTLPNVECDGCTLQLIQFSYGVPLERSTYHQCADLVLSADAPVDANAPVLVASRGAAEVNGADVTGDTVSATDATPHAGCSFGATRSSRTSCGWLTLLGSALLLRRRQPNVV